MPPFDARGGTAWDVLPAEGVVLCSAADASATAPTDRAGRAADGMLAASGVAHLDPAVFIVVAPAGMLVAELEAMADFGGAGVM